MAYVRTYGAVPGWMDDTGQYPRTWMHYLYGVQEVNREVARSTLAHYNAVRVAGAVEEKAHDSFWRTQRNAAGWDGGHAPRRLMTAHTDEGDDDGAE